MRDNLVDAIVIHIYICFLCINNVYPLSYKSLIKVFFSSLRVLGSRLKSFVPWYTNPALDTCNMSSGGIPSTLGHPCPLLPAKVSCRMQFLCQILRLPILHRVAKQTTRLYHLMHRETLSLLQQVFCSCEHL